MQHRSSAGDPDCINTYIKTESASNLNKKGEWPRPRQTELKGPTTRVARDQAPPPDGHATYGLG